MSCDVWGQWLCCGRVWTWFHTEREFHIQLIEIRVQTRNALNFEVLPQQILLPYLSRHSPSTAPARPNRREWLHHSRYLISCVAGGKPNYAMDIFVVWHKRRSVNYHFGIQQEQLGHWDLGLGWDHRAAPSDSRCGLLCWLCAPYGNYSCWFWSLSQTYLMVSHHVLF